MFVCPEGIRTNGKYLIRFKRGAFAALLPVTPAIIRYDYYTLNPTTEPLGFSLIPLLFSDWIPSTVTLDAYVPFIPNDYLFTEYAKKIPDGDKMEKWEIYAYAVRDMMAKEGPFIKSTKTGREIMSYKLFMKGIKNEFTFEGKTFKWPHTSLAGQVQDKKD